jgi:hypothetical protein
VGALAIFVAGLRFGWSYQQPDEVGVDVIGLGDGRLGEA